ncbi:hypothetical protein [Nocardia sp. NPDC004415]
MTMSFDPDALAAYTRAAARVSELLGEAATNTTAAAGIDLSGLGLLGKEFAAAWSRAATQHAATLSTAANLVGNYEQILTGYGTEVTDTDTSWGADLTTIEEGLA